MTEDEMVECKIMVRGVAGSIPDGGLGCHMAHGEKTQTKTSLQHSLCHNLFPPGASENY